MNEEQIEEEKKLRQKEYMRTYYLKNKQRFSDNAKRWKTLNREKWNEYQKEKARERYKSDNRV